MSTHGGAVAPPPPGKTEAEVTTAAGSLLAATERVQAAERAKQQSEHQALIGRLPSSATWLPGAAVPESPGPSAATAASARAGDAAEAPATPQAAAAPPPAPASPASPRPGAGLEPAAAAAVARLDKPYKQPAELLAAPPGGQVSIAGRRLATGEVPLPEAINIADAAAAAGASDACAEGGEEQPEPPAAPSAAPVTPAPPAQQGQHAQHAPAHETASTPGQVYGAHAVAAGAAARAAALVHIGIPVPEAAGIAEASQDPSASFDADSSVSAGPVAGAAAAVAGAEEGAEASLYQDPPEILRRMRSHDLVPGPAEEPTAPAAAAPEAPDTPGPLARTAPELLRAHDRAARAAAVAGALVHAGRPVPRSANMAEAVEEPGDVIDFDSARTSQAAAAAGAGTAPAGEQREGGGGGVSEGGQQLPDTVPDLLAAARGRAGASAGASGGAGWEAQVQTGPEEWERAHIVSCAPGGGRGARAAAPAGPGAAQATPQAVEALESALEGEQSQPGSGDLHAAPSLTRSGVSAVAEAAVTAIATDALAAAAAAKAGGAPAGTPEHATGAAEELQSSAGQLGGVVKAIQGMIGQQQQTAPPQQQAPASAERSGAAQTPATACAPSFGAAGAPRDALACNARLMSQLSHGRAGQGPKALGVVSDSRLSNAGSSSEPSRIPSAVAMSDTDAPAPPPPTALPMPLPAPLERALEIHSEPSLSAGLAPPPQEAVLAATQEPATPAAPHSAPSLSTGIAPAPPATAEVPAGAEVGELLDQECLIGRVINPGLQQQEQQQQQPAAGVGSSGRDGGSAVAPGAGDAPAPLRVSDEVLLAAGLDPGAGSPLGTPRMGSPRASGPGLGPHGLEGAAACGPMHAHAAPCEAPRPHVAASAHAVGIGQRREDDMDLKQPADASAAALQDSSHAESSGHSSGGDRGQPVLRGGVGGESASGGSDAGMSRSSSDVFASADEDGDSEGWVQPEGEAQPLPAEEAGEAEVGHAATRAAPLAASAIEVGLAAAAAELPASPTSAAALAAAGAAAAAGTPAAEGGVSALRDDVVLGVWPAEAAPPQGSGDGDLISSPVDQILPSPAGGDAVRAGGSDSQQLPFGAGSELVAGDAGLEGGACEGVGPQMGEAVEVCEIAGAQELLAADTSRAPGGAVGGAPSAGAGEGATEEAAAEGGEEEGRYEVTLADVVRVAVAPAGSRRLLRARAKAVAAAAAAAGLRAAGRPLRVAAELAEIATAPADIVDASAAHAGGATADATWEQDAQAAQGGGGAAAEWQGRWQARGQEAAAGVESEAEGEEQEDDSDEPAGRGPLKISVGNDDLDLVVDLGRAPTSPINRVDSCVPLAAEMSVQLSVSSAASLPLGSSDEGAVAAALASPAVGEANGRAGCVLPRPEALPAAVEARNRSARVAAAACGLRYAGLSVRDAAAVAEIVFSSAAAVEAAAVASLQVAPSGSGGGDLARPSAPPVLAAPAGGGMGLTCRCGDSGAAAAAAPAGEEGDEGALEEPLLGPASPKAAARAALQEKWARGDV